MAVTVTNGRFGSQLEWATAGRPMPGELVSGDSHVVEAVPDGVFLAVIDGLGHGEKAAEAAGAAVAVLREPAGDLMGSLQRCHGALARTRGAAVTLARLDLEARLLGWLGVGNIEAVLVDADPHASKRHARLAVPGGVVGYQLPKVRARDFPLPAAGALALATDGVHTQFTRDVDPWRDPASLAGALLERHARTTDDALVLTVRWGLRK